jgi:voltage-gated potassium channel
MMAKTLSAKVRNAEAPSMNIKNLVSIVQRRAWQIVEVAGESDQASKVFDISILALIFLNVLAVIIGTVPSVRDIAGRYLDWFEILSVIVFSGEYLVRLWSCVADSRFQPPFLGRMRMIVRPMAIVDLLAILPFYLPFLGIDLRSLRVLRLLRILRIAKVGRYYASLNIMKNVFRSRKEELVLTSAVMALLLVVSSSLLYYCENEAQPEAFSSIPATMWWAVAALTTVGYGDIYPVTFMGKCCASIIAILVPLYKNPIMFARDLCCRHRWENDPLL